MANEVLIEERSFESAKAQYDSLVDSLDFWSQQIKTSEKFEVLVDHHDASASSNDSLANILSARKTLQKQVYKVIRQQASLKGEEVNRYTDKLNRLGRGLHRYESQVEEVLGDEVKEYLHKPKNEADQHNFIDRLRADA